MNYKRLIKGVAIALLSFMALFMATMVVVMNYVLTPAQLTPVVLSTLQEQITTEVSLERVDVRFFSSFPYITLEVDSLRIPLEVDSVDLVVARKASLAVNPFALLRKVVAVEKFTLEGAAINLYVDEEHRVRDIFVAMAEDAEDEAESDMIQGGALKGYRFAIDKVAIDSSVIVVDDRTKDFYSKMDGLSIDLSVRLSSRRSRLNAVIDLNNWEVNHLGKELVANTSLHMETEVKHLRDSMLFAFEESKLHINKIGMRAHGTLRRDTVNNGVEVDIRGGLRTGSLSEIAHLIPTQFLEDKTKLTASGKAQLNMRYAGLYSDTSQPRLWVEMAIEDGMINFGKNKLPLEQINCHTGAYVDFNNIDSSYVSVKEFRVSSSDIIDIAFDGRIDNVIEHPLIDANINSYINFDRFTEVFPMQDGIDVKGSNTSDVRAKFALADIETKNYGNLYIEGESRFDKVFISVDGKVFLQDTTSTAYLYVEMEKGTLLFGDKVKENKSRTLLSTINLTGLDFKDKHGQYAMIKDLTLTAGANFDSKTKQVNGVGVRAAIKNLNGGADSLIDVTAERSDITLTIVPESESRKATIMAKALCESVAAVDTSTNTTINLSEANLNLTSVNRRKRMWSTDGTVGFADLNVYSDLFPLPMHIPNSSVSVGKDKINLSDTRLRVGESELVATGYISNLIRLFLQDREGDKKRGKRVQLEGELAIHAPLLNMDELIEATNRSVMMSDTTQLYSDSVGVAANDSTSALLLVPQRVKFGFDLDVAKMQFNNSSIDDIKGRATIEGGVLMLEQLSLSTIGAQATTSVVYRNVGSDSALVSMNMHMQQVDITRIGEIVPAIDSIMPMIKSFEGIVDFDFKAKSMVDKELMFDFNTIRSAASFKGKDMVLMDSETFAQLSKLLLFKNKDRNLVDSLEVYMINNKRMIQVLPFEMNIDRYRAIIGGSQAFNEQTFELFYNYNVSILKSPLPFKAGVDLKGSLDNFDYSVTKAKLKDTDFKVQREIYDAFYNKIE